MITYLVPNGYGEAEFTEKHSRFIGRVWRTDSEAEALDCLRQTREKNRDATHNVFAYIIRDNNISRFSDDGEPQGTSGLPTLNVFASEGIQNVCCVVTRYFGGTLLGAGGLVRAYSRAAKMALDEAGIAQMGEWRSYIVSCEYGFFERAKRILDEHGASVKDTDFGADVVIEALLRADVADGFEQKLKDASSGKAQYEITGSEFLGVRVK